MLGLGSDWMLDAYVIEEIKRREQRSQRDERPVADLPVPPPPDQQPPDRQPPDQEPARPTRGVVIIDLGG